MTSDTLENFLADNIHFSANTVRNYTAAAAALLDYADGRGLTSRLVEEWTVAMMRENQAISTIHLKRRLVKHICRWAVEAGQGTQIVGVMKSLPHDPQESETDKCITPAEFDRLMAYPYPESDLFFPEMVRCSWETGLRLGDVVRLQWEHVELENRAIKVKPQKTRRQRSNWIHVPISETLAGMLKVRDDARQTSQVVWPEAVFQADHCGLCWHSNRFRHWAKKCGLPKGKCFHGLRHARITTLLEAGESTAMVRAFTGHSLAVLERYAGHVSLEAKRAAFDRANENMKRL